MNKGFVRAIRNFFSQLGITEEMIERFISEDSTNYRTFLEGIGVRKVRYRESLRKIPEVGHRALILPGGNAVILTTLSGGKCAVLVQRRDDGYLGFPGGAIEEWEYNGKLAVELPALAAYREFLEEVGINFDGELELFDENSTTILYPNKDVAYGVSLFYKTWVPYEKVKHLAEGDSDEGKMVIVTIDALGEEKLFENHLPVFNRLMTEEV